MAKRRTKAVGELGRALAARELELGLGREQAVERIREMSDEKSLAIGTYYGWLRGVKPSEQFHDALAEHLGVRRIDILGMLDILSPSRLRLSNLFRVHFDSWTIFGYSLWDISIPNPPKC